MHWSMGKFTLWTTVRPNVGDAMCRLDSVRRRVSDEKDNLARVLAPGGFERSFERMALSLWAIAAARRTKAGQISFKGVDVRCETKRLGDTRVVLIVVAEGDEPEAQVIGVGEIYFLPKLVHNMRDLIASLVDVWLQTSGRVLDEHNIART